MDSNFSYITISIFILILTKLLFSFCQNKKKYPPCPCSLPIIGHLHLFKKPLHQCLARLSDRYGPIILLCFGSRPVLVVSSFSIAEECFTKNDIVFANRSHLPSFKHLSYNYTTIGTANYGPHWRNLRRIATVEVLSSHRLNSFVVVRALEVHALVRRLFRESNPNGKFTKVELKSRLYEFSLNNLMRMIAGKRSADSEEVAKFMESVEELFKLNGASNIGDFLPFLGWMDIDGVRKRAMRLAKYRNEFLQRLIDEHKIKSTNDGEDGCQGKTMIGDLLSFQKTDPEYYTDQIIKGLIIPLLEETLATASLSLLCRPLLSTEKKSLISNIQPTFQSNPQISTDTLASSNLHSRSQLLALELLPPLHLFIQIHCRDPNPLPNTKFSLFTKAAVFLLHHRPSPTNRQH